MLNVFHVIIVYLAFCENNGACQRNSTCYFNSLYGPGCKCNRGYEYNIYLNTCDPINICLSNATTCPANSTCESTGPGTSICNCHQGYTMNSTQHCVISKYYFPFDISWSHRVFRRSWCIQRTDLSRYHRSCFHRKSSVHIDCDLYVPEKEFTGPLK